MPQLCCDDLHSWERFDEVGSPPKILHYPAQSEEDVFLFLQVMEQEDHEVDIALLVEDFGVKYAICM